MSEALRGFRRLHHRQSTSFTAYSQHYPTTLIQFKHDIHQEFIINPNTAALSIAGSRIGFRHSFRPPQYSSPLPNFLGEGACKRGAKPIPDNLERRNPPGKFGNTSRHQFDKPPLRIVEPFVRGGGILQRNNGKRCL
ncbi:hypothetical protein CDAR_253591 [Caerostris darwini]|uniref:Uncharacterized protein n=1 Tax=Caerostris darwini TaxID=1538125 RepID=A0AAV4Q806_9ARAC|nr:hypothetical protein CDAR_253591 [Caerostris darwini]